MEGEPVGQQAFLPAQIQICRENRSNMTHLSRTRTMMLQPRGKALSTLAIWKILLQVICIPSSQPQGGCRS